MQRGWTRWMGRTGTTCLFFLFFSEKKKDTKDLAVNQQFQTPPKAIFLYVKFGNNCLLPISVLFLFFCRVFSFFSLLTVVEKNLQIFNDIQKKI